MGSSIDGVEVSRLDVVDSGRRRRWTEDEKLRVVTESLSGPRMVSITARRHGISRWQLSTWRRQFRVQAQPSKAVREEPSGLIPAVVVEAASLLAAASARRAAGGLGDQIRAPAPSSPAEPPGQMVIVMSSGRRIIVDAAVDAAALGRVLDVLERR